MKDGKITVMVAILAVFAGFVTFGTTVRAGENDEQSFIGKVCLAAENYNPQINPADFSTTINNLYFTLTPGTTFVYKNKVKDGIETNKMIVTNLTREVMGVKTLVVWDRVWLNNNLIEETYDWYAQDKVGNVWYFGEESREYKNGKATSTHGSWEAGVDGAKPGIIMKVNPQAGDSYRQEYYQGEADDISDILALNKSVIVPYGSFQNCLKTKNWTPLEPDLSENKYFCSEIGQMVLEVNNATGEKGELVDIQKNADFVFLKEDGKADNASASTKNNGESNNKRDDQRWLEDDDSKEDIGDNPDREDQLDEDSDEEENYSEGENREESFSKRYRFKRFSGKLERTS